ncbi:MAG: hypothetical protein SNJ57_19430 [Cyanobacteriota bacterium]
MTDILEKALEWANQNRPTTSTQHRAAFANSVAYLVTGASGGYGGPSLREHLVSWSLGTVGAVNIGGQAMTTITPGRLPMPGQWTFEAAVAHAAPLCFNHASKYLNTLLQIQEREYCFDDDPADLEALRGK